MKWKKKKNGNGKENIKKLVMKKMVKMELEKGLAKQ